MTVFNRERQKLYTKLLEAEEKIKFSAEKYTGSGFYNILKRLIKYRGKYLDYLISRLSKRVKIVCAKLFFGETIRCYLPCSYYLYIAGIELDEIKLTKFLVKNLPEKGNFFDLGASCGFYSLLARRLIKEGEIHAFEPSESGFKLLKENSQGKKKLFINQSAVYSSKKEIEFYTNDKDPEKSSMDISDNKRAKLVGNPVFKKVKIKAVSLDTYCREKNSYPNFIKIDVEGGEFHAIKGAEQVIKNHYPIIFMEVWKKPLDNRAHLNAINMLYAFGYKSYAINENGELELKKELNPDYDIKCGVLDNFIFKKGEK